MKKIIATTALILAFSAGSAFAEGTTSHSSGTTMHTNSKTHSGFDFKTLDTDQNGMLNSTELDASGNMDNVTFDDIDTNTNGSISPTEMDSWNSTNTSSGTNSSTTGSSMSQ